MSFLSMIYSFLFLPLQLIFEVVFSYALILTNENPGLAIVALSLAINFLVLPLYRRADAIQEEERDIEAKLSKGVSHIKKTFHGDERTMMLQMYYRQNNYSPLSSLRSATSLFLEIPFFIAAYRFLSNLALLKNTSFGPIANLGAEDALLTIGGVSINILPVLMTVLNIISTVIFTKNSSAKTKIQLYAMAAFFLVLLYSSPAGLVLYWTLNNLFSLIKTIFYKLKNPKKYLLILSFAAGVCFAAFGLFLLIKSGASKGTLMLCLLGAVLCLASIIVPLRQKKYSSVIRLAPDNKLFLGSMAFLALLTGLLIPSSIIAASPQEFLSADVYLNPIWYIVGSTLIAAGMFILWMQVFYRLFSDNAKIIFERIVAILCVAAIINYMFFGKNLGLISTDLKYDKYMAFSLSRKLINAGVLVIAAIITYIAIKKNVKIVRGTIAILTVVISIMSLINTVGIFRSVAKVDQSQFTKKTDSVIPLSKTNKNVVVFMLDRAMGEYIPFIFDEYPELEERFSGFTYYSNTISFGGHTNFGVPALFGGYEYTPAEINKRESEPLVEKHNEALKVMPVLFNENGFDVTVCDPPYSSYQEIPDLSIYNDYPDIRTFITQGMFLEEASKDLIVSDRQQKFFCHSIFKIAPVGLQSTVYASGNYHKLNSPKLSKAYNLLKNLSEITYHPDSSKGSFVMIDNDAAHDSSEFPDPSYINSSEEKMLEMLGTSRTVGGNTLLFNTLKQVNSFQNNIGALKRIGEWLDYLKVQDCYDNTRIILVADHGYAMNQIEALYFDETATDGNDANRHLGDMEFYCPLLMVKDFDSVEFTVSDEFMTNADVPTLATEGVIDDPVNPFTKKKINNGEKYAHDQYVIASDKWSVLVNNGNTFLPARWYSVHDSLWDMNNWKVAAENAVLP